MTKYLITIGIEHYILNEVEAETEAEAAAVARAIVEEAELELTALATTTVLERYVPPGWNVDSHGPDVGVEELREESSPVDGYVLLLK